MIKICVVGSKSFQRYMEEVQLYQEYSNIEFSYHQSSLELNYQELALKVDAEAPDIVLIGPTDHFNIEPYLKTPCYIIHPSIDCFLGLHSRIYDYAHTAFLFRYPDAVDLSALGSALGVTYHTFYYRLVDELGPLLIRLGNEGFRTIVTNHSAGAIAQKAGFRILYYYNRENFQIGIENALQVVKNLRRENVYVVEVNSILENVTSGVIGIQKSTHRVSFVNQTALNMLNQSNRVLMKKTMEQILPELICKQVVSLEKPENEVQFSICGVDVIGNICPIPLPDGSEVVFFFFENISRVLKHETMIRRKFRRDQFYSRYQFEDILGESPAITKTIQQARRYALHDAPIYIQAESGAGKEIFAHAIHEYSKRREYPFVPINCASLPDRLIEAELFGRESSDAGMRRSPGLFELANHGTVFLDDVDALSVSIQAKLMRVIQEEEIIQAGGNQRIPIDVRIITSSNQSLRKLAEKGMFRKDLYYRLSVLKLTVPPLRERREDIIPLIGYNLSSNDPKLYEAISDRLAEIFAPCLEYSYPGNVRELFSIITRFSILVEHSRLDNNSYMKKLVIECIGEEAEQAFEASEGIYVQPSGKFSEDMSCAEAEILKLYIRNFGGNLSKLAKEIGISRATLYNKLKSHQLDKAVRD